VYQQLTLAPLRNAAGHLTHYLSLYSNASPQLATSPSPGAPQHTHSTAAPQPHAPASETVGHVLDHQRLIALCTQPDGQSLGMIDSLFKLFRQATPITLLALRGALLQQQSQQIAALAHRLKGESSSLGAVRFWQLCRTIEIHASQNELAPIGPLLSELEREFERVSIALAAFAETLHSTTTTMPASPLDLPDTS
jgi:HPt (histidine-containing phosphotransfer) domain-containing protein